MYFDVGGLDEARSYKLLTAAVAPRPIAWVVTKGQDGAPNAAPYSLFNYFSGYPPVIAISMGQKKDGGVKDSLANLMERGEFVINMVSSELARAMNTTATPFRRGVNELALAELDVVQCENVDCVRIVKSPVALECRLSQIVPIPPTSNLVIAHVVGIHILDGAVQDFDHCYVDGAPLDLVGRMESPAWYTKTEQRFRMAQLTVDEWLSGVSPNASSAVKQSLF